MTKTEILGLDVHEVAVGMVVEHRHPRGGQGLGMVTIVDIENVRRSWTVKVRTAADEIKSVFTDALYPAVAA